MATGDSKFVLYKTGGFVLGKSIWVYITCVDTYMNMNLRDEQIEERNIGKDTQWLLQSIVNGGITKAQIISLGIIGCYQID